MSGQLGWRPYAPGHPFLTTIDARVAISAVIERRRVILPLAGATLFVARLKRVADFGALETIARLGGHRALCLALDELFERWPKKRRPRCRGAPLPWDAPELGQTRGFKPGQPIIVGDWESARKVFEGV